MTENTISIQNVSKTFTLKEKQLKGESRIIKAVNNLSFTVIPGEILGLIGLNGSGKTTTIKITSGVMKPDSGKILVAGEDPSKRTKNYLKKVSLVMGQKTRLNPDLSIIDSIMMYASFYSISPKEASKRIDFFSEIIGLESVDLKKQVRKLSLGQRMKGELTLAFIHQPKIIFLDEPTLGLDFLTGRKIRKFLKHYCTEYQASMILTSHDIEDIETLSDQLLLIDKGKKLFYGTKIQLESLIPNNSIITFKSVENFSNILKDTKYNKNRDFYTVEIKSVETQTLINKIIATQKKIENLTVKPIGLETLIEEVFKGV